MKIHHQGWNDRVGIFQCEVTIQETKSDHEIHFSNGIVSRQLTPFKSLTLDWNQDGHPYPKVGAFFDYGGHREFFTPQEMASLVLNADAYIPGLEIEDMQPNLSDRIQSASRRAEAASNFQQGQSKIRLDTHSR